MPSQTTTGKAFEFSVLRCIVKNTPRHEFAEVSCDSSYRIAQSQFASLEAGIQQEYDRAAQPAIEMLLRLEPNMLNGLSNSDRLHLKIQSDQTGGEGDVRDIVLSRPKTDWEIGISAKHHHEAMKHSRLSMSINFGEKWLGKSCSTNYFVEIEPVFKQLNELKSQHAKWSEMTDKESIVYIPILQAFRKELLRLSDIDPEGVSKNLATYLVGKMDFYKVMKLDNLTSVQAFNLRNKLSLSRGSVKSPVKLSRLKLPTRIIELDFKRGAGDSTTLMLVCDEGWQIAFRIHSASTYVEPSLKFDITVVGKPNSLRTFDFLWV